jgi:predicted DNA-binding transcriptional regulator AlpA
MIMNTKDMLTLAEVEQGYGLKRSTVYKYIRKGSITPYKKAGDRRSYFKRSELDKLTEFQPRETKTKRK